MPSQIDEIKAKIDIVDLVSEYVRLKQMGANWKALCPFHNEKSPSFMVSRDRQIWHCFGCSEGGDIFTFVQKIEGLDFPEALKFLAQKAGVKLERQNPELASQRNRLIDICNLAASFWHKILLDSSQGEKAREYLKKRQVKDETVAEFKLGYAPDSWDTLIKFLQGRGFKDEEIFLAGLSVKKERGQGFYDRFRDRLIFPIRDPHGTTVGFTGRTLKVNEQGGKYINTPQTLIYNKSFILYNLDKAKQEIKKQNLAVVVEGQMDALSSYQAGAINVVAVSGTAFTLDQLNILKRYTSNIAIAFDTDIAGESASKRGIDLALSQEMSVKIITLPKGKDPDECIKNNPADWFKAIKEAQSIMEYYFAQVKGRFDLTKPEGKREAAKILLNIINKIGNKIEQAHWLQQLGDLIKVDETVLRESLSRAKKDNYPQPNSTKPIFIKDKPVNDRNVKLSEKILSILIKFPEHLNYAIDNLALEIIKTEQLQRLYKELIIYYTKHVISSSDNTFEYNHFREQITTSGLEKVADTLMLLAEKDFFDFEGGAIKNELITMISSLKKDYLHEQAKELELMIKKAETENQYQDMENLLKKSQEILSQIRLLD